jgi:hypothetical protein
MNNQIKSLVLILLAIGFSVVSWTSLNTHAIELSNALAIIFLLTGTKFLNLAGFNKLHVNRFYAKRFPFFSKQKAGHSNHA